MAAHASSTGPETHEHPRPVLSVVPASSTPASGHRGEPRRRWIPRPRHTGRWDRDQVAAHLLDRQAPITRGLGYRPPWAGIDADTLEELYLSAAATICALAGEGIRPDWRTAKDLERAVIAAFRHEALSHWKTVNAQKRRADRDAVAFEPDRDAPSHPELERIFDCDPHEELVARDWIVQLHGQVRAFWEPVILEGIEYKQAGDRLGVTKAQRQALYRDGIEHLTRFRSLVEEGKVCQLRAPAIAAYHDGSADAVAAERARAHLDCCLACALTIEPRASALNRGLLALLPWPALTRLATRARDLLDTHPSETAGGVGGALLAGKGAIAVVCAGVVAGGACASGLGVLPSPLPHHHRSRHAAVHGVPDAAAIPQVPAGASNVNTTASEATLTRSARVTASDEFRTPSSSASAAVREFDVESVLSAADLPAPSRDRRARVARVVDRSDTGRTPPSTEFTTAPRGHTTAVADRSAVTKEFGGP